MNQYLVYDEEQGYSIYKHTNLQTGKVYYGIAQSPLDRWNEGNGYISNALFWKDIVAYGWRNFKHEIIFKNLRKEEAIILEGLLIQETQSYLPENGYNQNFRTIDFEEICVGENENDIDVYRVKRRGRNGQPVIYQEKYYPNIKTLAEAIDEDMTIISQGLNPNCTRKLPKYLLDNGLRYATEEEIEMENT